MAEIWVVFGHSAMISNKEKWPADCYARTQTTVPPTCCGGDDILLNMHLRRKFVKIIRNGIKNYTNSVLFASRCILVNM